MSDYTTDDRELNAQLAELANRGELAERLADLLGSLAAPSLLINGTAVPLPPINDKSCYKQCLRDCLDPEKGPNCYANCIKRCKKNSFSFGVGGLLIEGGF